MIFLETIKKAHRVVEISEKCFREELISDYDKETLGLYVRKYSIELIFYYYPKYTNSKGLSYVCMSVQTNNFNILHTLAKEDDIQIVNDLTKHPTFHMPYERILDLSTFDKNEYLKLAKKETSFSQRCAERAYDLAFIVFLRKLNINVSVKSMESLMKIFKDWITSDGTLVMEKSLKICEKTLRQ